MSRYECRGVGLKAGMADRLPAGKEVQNSMDQAASEDKKSGTGWVKVSRDIQDHWVWD